MKDGSSFLLEDKTCGPMNKSFETNEPVKSENTHPVYFIVETWVSQNHQKFLYEI